MFADLDQVAARIRFDKFTCSESFADPFAVRRISQLFCQHAWKEVSPEIDALVMVMFSVVSHITLPIDCHFYIGVITSCIHWIVLPVSFEILNF